MRIATWNVNSIKQRLDHLLAYLGEAEPDVVCLQEIKCPDAAFPREAVEGAGYNVATHGQKAFNGVAILAKRPIEVTRRGLPGEDEDDHARYIEALIPAEGRVARVASIYLPNGNPVRSPKFGYKLRWMERLKRRAAELLELEEPLALAGDFNVIPDDRDCKNPESWRHDALFQPETRAAWRGVQHLGLTDALRACDDGPGRFTFWDYQAGCWQKNDGLRIDHVLLSPQAADRLRGVAVHKHTRAWDKPSDHVPVMVELDL